MVDELIGMAAVVFGGLAGSTMITLFPYFLDKNAVEANQEQIRRKPESDRTDDENYLLNLKYPGFFAEYKFRFGFGLLVGVGAVLAFLNSNLSGISAMTTGTALFAGFTASGMFSALADKIRSTSNVSKPVVATIAAKESTQAPPVNKP